MLVVSLITWSAAQRGIWQPLATTASSPGQHLAIRLMCPNPIPWISNCPLALHALPVRCVPGPQACFAFWSWHSTSFKERKEADKESEDSWSDAESRNCFSFLLLVCCSASAHGWESWKLLCYIPVGYMCKKTAVAHSHRCGHHQASQIESSPTLEVYRELSLMFSSMTESCWTYPLEKLNYRN